MKRIAESGYADFFKTCFLLVMAGNKEMLYRFSTLLKSTPLGGFR